MVGNKKFVIKYQIILDEATPLKNKEIKIDNCSSSIHAQVKLEDYLKRKYINFQQLVVESCTEDFLSGFGIDGMDDIFGKFGDIFKGK